MKLTINVQQLLDKAAYFGHKISRTSPKALAYTYKAQHGIYLIDLFKTKVDIENALQALFKAGQANEELLVVGTKRLIKAYLKELLKDTSIHYLSEKWVGGFLTNFDEMLKNIKETNKMQEAKQKGDWNSLPKHEVSRKDKRLNKSLKVYEGVLKLQQIPQNILIIDVKKEKNALKEALSLKTNYQSKLPKGFKLFGIVDTNADPTMLDYPMMLNDDSAAALEYVVKHLTEAYQAGLKKVKTPKGSNVQSKQS